MARHATAIAAIFLVLGSWVWALSAAEMEGRIITIDPVNRTLTLESGAKIQVADQVALDALREGDDVTVSYEEKDGTPVAIRVDTK
jgi:Cu/Ag efflux protein CusF